MFANFTVARKISSVVAVALLSLLLTGVLSYRNSGKLVRTAGWVTHTHEVLEANQRILSLLKDAETGQRGYLITGESRYLEPYLRAKSDIAAVIQTAKSLTSDNATQQERFSATERLIASKFTELQETVDLRRTQSFEAARAVVLTDKGKQVMDDIRGKLADIEAAERSLLKNRSEEARQSASFTMAFVIWGNLCAFLATATLAYFVIAGINIALRRSAAELSQGAQQVASAAGQLSSSSQALAQGASEQAASLEETSASSEQINAMARKNTEDSHAAAELVSRTQQKILETNASLDHMVSAMHDIEASSGRISQIIRTIDEIAFQTNILALNAAVEAARAGEAGMGFAVVADEVRSLSQRCAQAARTTADLIEESIAKAGDGKAKVDEVAAAIRAITDASGKVRNLVDEVNQGSREQASGIEQVARAVSQMEQVTQKSVASAEESASAAQELTAQSQSLQAIVHRLTALVDGGSALVGTARSRHADWLEAR